MVKRYSKSKGEYLQCSDKECKYEKIIEKKIMMKITQKSSF